MLGLFIVQITAAGCLYFLDPTNIANGKGLAAAGVLLMLLNVAYVVAMLILIANHGARKTIQHTRAAFELLKVSSMRFKQSISGRRHPENERGATPAALARSLGSQVRCQGSHFTKWDLQGD